MVHIRVFAAEDTGFMKYINFLRSELDLRIEMCDPNRWQPTEPADIHLYVDAPVRMAVPWAGFNVLASLEIPFEFEWCKSEMNMMIDRDALQNRDRALSVLRGMVRAVKKRSEKPKLPVAPERGAIPPKIGVVTVTRNRPQWWYNMVQNVTKQKWPVSRMEWIIVDDSDADKRLTAQVKRLGEIAPALVIKYVVLDEPLTIGEKRNLACKTASEDVTVFACMDDDDHYPEDSLAIRASWLTRPGTDIVYCSTLPMYDVRRYISAWSVPPLGDGPTSRVSEATLCFKRSVFEEKEFPEVSMAEGDYFLWDRVERSVEIPPTGVIVSFIHSANTSSRRVPADQEPNGSHFGFSDDYFRWLCQVGGAGEVSSDQQSS